MLGLLVAINLQTIAELLEQSWTFFIALDMSTHMSTLYLDIRLRLHILKYGILNVLFWRFQCTTTHWRGHILDCLFFCEALDAVLPQWRDIIIGTSLDGKK